MTLFLDAYHFYRHGLRALRARRRALELERGGLTLIAGASPRLARHLDELQNAIAREKQTALGLLAMIGFFLAQLFSGRTHAEVRSVRLDPHTPPPAKAKRRLRFPAFPAIHQI